jgi:tellurite resistance protein TerC
MTSLEYPLWVWVFFFSVVLVALFVDIGIVNRKSHAPKRRETIIWSIIWVSLALAFNAFIAWQFGVGTASFSSPAISSSYRSRSTIFSFSFLIFHLFQGTKEVSAPRAVLGDFHGDGDASCHDLSRC